MTHNFYLYLSDNLGRHHVIVLVGVHRTSIFSRGYRSVLPETNVHLLELREYTAYILCIKRNVSNDKIIAFMNNRLALDEMELTVSHRKPSSMRIKVRPTDLRYRRKDGKRREKICVAIVSVKQAQVTVDTNLLETNDVAVEAGRHGNV